MPGQSLAQWLDRLERLDPTKIELGLDRTAAVAARLDVLQPAATVVTVAGTNGKGSTCLLLEAMARRAGRRVGVYTSPHLLRYNERIRLHGCEVADAELVSAFEAVEAARDDIPLTYFEFGTLAALVIFQRAALDLLILEVGLGGRLDAVNVLDPDVAIITSISLDHQSWLGDDREAIAREKAGILREGIDAIIADPDPPRSLRAAVAEKRCRAIYFDTAGAALPVPPQLRAENVFAAHAAMQVLQMAPTPAQFAALTADLVVPARLQRIELPDRSVVVDVAHNPAAVENLVQWVEKSITGPRIALFAALSDKDIHAMMRPCYGVFEHCYVAALPGVARAADSAELAAAASAAGITATPCESVAVAWQRLQREHPGTSAVVFGSFFTAACFFELLGEGHGLD